MRTLHCNLAALLALCLTACRQDVPEKDDDHADKPTFCSFKEGRGVQVAGETHRALGIATTEVQKRNIPRVIKTAARIFAPGRALVLLDSDQGKQLQINQPVSLYHGSLSVTGKLTAAPGQWAHGIGNGEAVIEFTSSDAQFAEGRFVSALISLETNESLAVPASSLLRAGTGAFVYVANESHFLRTAVEVGGEGGGWVAIKDGLSQGNMVVTKGAQGLWIIELNATKAGAACCPADEK